MWRGSVDYMGHRKTTTPLQKMTESERTITDTVDVFLLVHVLESRRIAFVIV